jgi:3-oxoacyl-[acyl-carrier-protein] synthase II
MEAWQRIGTYAAGLALDSAGVKGNTEILSRMDMIVAAGGGERPRVDASILSGFKAADPALFNERLMNDLRPTLFLAAFNLLAGNISIVHSVTGSSRTFMGEETVRPHGSHGACVGPERPDAGSRNAARKEMLCS